MSLVEPRLSDGRRGVARVARPRLEPAGAPGHPACSEVVRLTTSVPVRPSWSVRRTLPLCIFVVLLAAAFTNGVRTTWGLRFPDVDLQAPGVDLYRDMALAQTLLDSGYGPDPSTSVNGAGTTR